MTTLEVFLAGLLGLGPLPEVMPAQAPAAPPQAVVVSPTDAAMAASLLSAEPGTPEVVPAGDDWPRVQAALYRVAEAMEILDPREARYVLGKPEDYQTDLDILRRRRVELDGAPLVAEAGRLPDRRVVNDFVKFNREFRKRLEARLPWETDRADVLGAAIKEADYLYRVWDAVRDARCEFYYVTVRRAAMKRLGEMLGEEAYRAGELPPPVPEWRFTDR